MVHVGFAISKSDREEAARSYKILEGLGQTAELTAASRVLARASRHTRRSMFSIARLYSTRRPSLNVYALGIYNVDDNGTNFS